MGIVLSHTRKWLIYMVSFFIFFASLLVILEYIHEKKFRIGILNEKLDNYSVITEQYLQNRNILNSGNYQLLDSVQEIISDAAVRITLIDLKGAVLYDSQVNQPQATMENHFLRPEVKDALRDGKGVAIRTSETTHVRYYYYAKRAGNAIIRISTVYNSGAKRFVQPGRITVSYTHLTLPTKRIV
jgi:two-component system OmpR family sensor kinase/two-component system phosphate regulon sensor histidine kinase PhoR